jgi:hypothetical protein
LSHEFIISFHIRIKLGNPKVRISLWEAGQLAALVAVPKASMHEYWNLGRGR